MPIKWCIGWMKNESRTESKSLSWKKIKTQSIMDLIKIRLIIDAWWWDVGLNFRCWDQILMPKRTLDSYWNTSGYIVIYRYEKKKEEKPILKKITATKHQQTSNIKHHQQQQQLCIKENRRHFCQIKKKSKTKQN